MSDSVQGAPAASPQRQSPNEQLPGAHFSEYPERHHHFPSAIREGLAITNPEMSEGRQADSAGCRRRTLPGHGRPRCGGRSTLALRRLVRQQLRQLFGWVGWQPLQHVTQVTPRLDA